MHPIFWWRRSLPFLDGAWTWSGTTLEGGCSRPTAVILDPHPCQRTTCLPASCRLLSRHAALPHAAHGPRRGPVPHLPAHAAAHDLGRVHGRLRPAHPHVHRLLCRQGAGQQHTVRGSAFLDKMRRGLHLGQPPCLSLANRRHSMMWRIRHAVVTAPRAGGPRCERLTTGARPFARRRLAQGYTKVVDEGKAVYLLMAGHHSVGQHTGASLLSRSSVSEGGVSHAHSAPSGSGSSAVQASTVGQATHQAPPQASSAPTPPGAAHRTWTAVRRGAETVLWAVVGEEPRSQVVAGQVLGGPHAPRLTLATTLSHRHRLHHVLHAWRHLRLQLHLRLALVALLEPQAPGAGRLARHRHHATPLVGLAHPPPKAGRKPQLELWAQEEPQQQGGPGGERARGQRGPPGTARRRLAGRGRIRANR